MKTTTSILKITALLYCATLIAHASLTVPGANGTDGVLNITENTVIDLSLAPTGTWDQDNSANAGKGVYDPEKWAVVFKYTSVNIATGATVTFNNHPSRAPVVWLVSGNVTIAGTVSLNGQGSVPAPLLSEPGPGGFRGGAREYLALVGRGDGFGMGGGRRNLSNNPWDYPASGSFGSLGAYSFSSIYGNPSLLPLIGGSGGGAGGSGNNGGGAGGGAILIACGGSVSINGILRANGGVAAGNAGSGSGGGIRVLANAISGSGSMFAIGGSSASSGGNGRIRIERTSDTSTIAIQPAPSVVNLSENATALLWPPAGSPEVKLLNIGGEAVPDDPRAAFGTLGADVALPDAPSVVVVVETRNVEPESQVFVRITPRDSANFTQIEASRVDPPVSTDPLTYHWHATLPTGLGYAAFQARVVRP